MGQYGRYIHNQEREDHSSFALLSLLLKGVGSKEKMLA